MDSEPLTPLSSTENDLQQKQQTEEANFPSSTPSKTTQEILDGNPHLATIKTTEVVATATSNTKNNNVNSTGRDFYRSQTSAINQELLDATDEAFNILQGTESLVVTEAEKWRKRFFDALNKSTKSVTVLLNQYGVASELMEMEKFISLDELEIPPLIVDDTQVRTVLTANHLENEEYYYPFPPEEIDQEQDEENKESPQQSEKEKEKEKEKKSENNMSAANNNKPKGKTISVSAETQSQLDRAPSDFQHNNTRQSEEYASLLRELRINSRSSNSSSKTSQARFLEVQDKLQRAAEMLLPTTLHKCSPVQSVIQLAQSLQADPLSHTKLEINRIQHLVEEIESELQAKLRDRQGSAVTEHYVLVEELNEEVGELYKDAMKHLLSAFHEASLASGDVKEFLNNVNSIDASLGSLELALNEQESLSEGAESDLNLLERQLEVRNLRREKEEEDFNLEHGRLMDEMDHLHQKHSVIWNEVLAKLNELQGVNEKIGGVKSAVGSLVTKHAGVEAHHLKEIQCISRLISMRRCVSTNAKKGAEILAATKNYASDMLQLVAKKEHETTRQKLALEQCVKFYDAYSGYVTHLQECAGKKEQRLENSKRLKRSVNFQVEVAGQTFDPNVTKYREQLLGLNDLIASMEESVKKIQTELHEGEHRKMWKETVEPELIAAGIPFEEPSQRVQHLRLDMLQRQFAAVDAFQREEQHKLDEERRVVRVMKNLVVQNTNNNNISNHTINNNSLGSPSMNAASLGAFGSSSPIPTNNNNNNTSMMASERRTFLNSALFSNNNNANNNNSSGTFVDVSQQQQGFGGGSRRLSSRDRELGRRSPVIARTNSSNNESEHGSGGGGRTISNNVTPTTISQTSFQPGGVLRRRSSNAVYTPSAGNSNRRVTINSNVIGLNNNLNNSTTGNREAGSQGSVVGFLDDEEL